jgi:putative hydrolase of the HAD superfamily
VKTPRLSTVFLDAGGVLVYPNWTRISAALAKQGVVVAPEALARAEPAAKKQIDERTTVATTDDASRGWQYFDLLLTAAGVPLSSQTESALAELRAYHRERNLWELVPDRVAPALQALVDMQLRLAIVSNANGTLCAHLDRLGISRYAHCVLDSHEHGVEKPDPRLFQIALKRTGATPDTTIHVGDLYHIDVLGARAANIRGVLLDEQGLYDGVDCPRVRSLDELVTRIRNGEFDDPTR